MRRDVRADLEHDLRVPAQRHPTRLTPPATPADEYGNAAPRGRSERRRLLHRQRRTPGAKQIRQHQPRTGPHKHHPRRLKRHETPVTARGGHATR